ncbi:MAG: hypothetical protein IKB89_05525 [Clostridia bacterium]|nr:hypothetical protein [Clostridia bacterium]
MEDIRIYDFDFNLLCIENRTISSNWHLKNNGIGSFEMHFTPDSEICEVIQESFDITKNKLIVVVQGNKQGILTGFRIKDELAVYGKTCNFLLSKRMVPNFSTKNLDIKKDVESISRYCVENAFADVENFVLGDIVGFDEIYTGDKHFWRNVYNPASEVVHDLMDIGGGGHFVLFDIKNKRWVFNTTKNEVNPMMISVQMKNAYDIENTKMVGDYCSCGWYEQQQTMEDGVRPDSVWTYIEKDEKTGIYRWEGKLAGLYESEATKELKSKKTTDDTELALRKIFFEKDFRLGDIIKLQYKFGKYERTISKIIDGVYLTFEHNNISEKPVFKEVE